MKIEIKCPYCSKTNGYDLDDYQKLESFFKSKNPLIKNYSMYIINCSHCGKEIEYREYEKD